MRLRERYRARARHSGNHLYLIGRNKLHANLDSAVAAIGANIGYCQVSICWSADPVALTCLIVFPRVV